MRQFRHELHIKSPKFKQIAEAVAKYGHYYFDRSTEAKANQLQEATATTSSLKAIFSMDKWMVLNAVARNVIKALKDAGVYVKAESERSINHTQYYRQAPERGDCSRI